MDREQNVKRIKESKGAKPKIESAIATTKTEERRSKRKARKDKMKLMQERAVAAEKEAEKGRTM